jgi:hypothetical protein
VGAILTPLAEPTPGRACGDPAPAADHPEKERRSMNMDLPCHLCGTSPVDWNDCWPAFCPACVGKPITCDQCGTEVPAGEAEWCSAWIETEPGREPEPVCRACNHAAYARAMDRRMAQIPARERCWTCGWPANFVVMPSGRHACWAHAPDGRGMGRVPPVPYRPPV